MEYNEFNQPVGKRLPDWKPVKKPVAKTLDGCFCKLEALDAKKHGKGLFEVFQLAGDGRDWTYLPGMERPESEMEMKSCLNSLFSRVDGVHFAVIDKATDSPAGSVAFMRIDPVNGVLEIGCVNWSRLMQRKPPSTEAIFLLLRYAFDVLGYRRCEWKCDSLNRPSRNAALRYGFEFEGTFKNALVTKGRNRDTDWFAITDALWPSLKAAFVAWLSPDNFDAAGQQKKRLQDFRSR